jgi:3',5'-cyclic AMP phosphodiesterase CpdA
MTEPLTFIHLTDLHIGNPEVPDDRLFSDTSSTLATILSEVKRISPKPRFLVASGDLTNQGDEGSYDELMRLFDDADLDMPVLFALGNHDKRDGFYRAVKGRTENLGKPYDHSTVIDDLHIIVLDTSAPFKVGGIFEPGQAEWLETELNQHAELPKLLVMHHAPALDRRHRDAAQARFRPQCRRHPVRAYPLRPRQPLAWNSRRRRRRPACGDRHSRLSGNLPHGVRRLLRHRHDAPLGPDDLLRAAAVGAPRTA